LAVADGIDLLAGQWKKMMDGSQLRCGYHNRWRYHHPDHDPGPHDNPTAGQHWWLETTNEHHVLRRSSRAARGPDEATIDLATTHAWRPVAAA
jgi:hypothetical protein